MEVIVLAGGLGTRLRSVVEDVPKCMAPVAGKPFLAYILDYLETQFVDHVILSLGYKHEVVIDWLRVKAFTFKVSWVIEREPLGTGGGIKMALQKAKNPAVYILNGDTFFDVNLRAMQGLLTEDTQAVLALKPLQNFDRYGTVTLNEQHTITAFEEKQAKAAGLINGGIYLLKKAVLLTHNYPTAFSFEKAFLEPEAQNQTLKGLEQDGLFIDIGIPEDFERAQTIFAK